jgi:hypothetical protein
VAVHVVHHNKVLISNKIVKDEEFEKPVGLRSDEELARSVEKEGALRKFQAIIGTLATSRKHTRVVKEMQEELEGEQKELGEKEQMKQWDEQMKQKKDSLAEARAGFNASMEKLNGELSYLKR